MPNPLHSPGVVPGPTRPGKLGRHELRSSFHAWVANVAKRLRCSVNDLSTSECQFLRDLQRDEVRYPMTALVRLAEIAGRSTLVHHREGLPQMLRALIVAQRGDEADRLDVETAFDGETDAQGAFDKAQFRYGRAPTRENHTAAIAAGQQQLAWTQASLDSLYATPPSA